MSKRRRRLVIGAITGVFAMIGGMLAALYVVIREIMRNEDS